MFYLIFNAEILAELGLKKYSREVFNKGLNWISYLCKLFLNLIGSFAPYVDSSVGLGVNIRDASNDFFGRMFGNKNINKFFIGPFSSCTLGL